MVMIDAVERRGQICVQRPQALGQRASAGGEDRRDRVVAAAARPEPIGPGFEPGFPLGLQRVTDPLLVAAVHQHGDVRFILLSFPGVVRLGL